MQHTKPLKRLFRNKKGIIIGDLFQSVLDGIRSFFNWFFQTLPKPLLAILFLAFILLMGNFLIPLVLNTTGYHCDANGQVWKVSGLSVFSNLDIMRNKPEINGDLIDIPFLCNRASIALCTDCNASAEDVCQDDGYRLNKYNWGQQFHCNWLGCAPPEGYFYNLTVNKFDCNEDFCINASLEDYNQKLYSIEGAAPVKSSDDTDFSAEGMIYFKCQANDPTNIRLTFFGIDIFDFRIWVALFVLGAFVWFKSKLM